LKKVRGDRRLGIRQLHPGRKTFRARRYEELLSLPRARKGSRPRLHAIRTLVPRCDRRSRRPGTAAGLLIEVYISGAIHRSFIDAYRPTVGAARYLQTRRGLTASTPKAGDQRVPR